MKHVWRFSLLAYPLVGAALAFGGCGGDNAVSFNGTDGGSDGTAGGADATDGDGGGGSSDDGGAQDARVDGALACPTYTGADPYCRALVAYCGRCPGQVAACDLVNFASCEKVSALFSVDGRKAVVDCTDMAACDRDAGARKRCVDDALLTATPSAEHTKLAQDYCALCPGAVSPAQCAADFYVSSDGGAGRGEGLLELGAALVGAIDGKCVALITSDAGDAGVANCGAKFAACALGVIAKASPPDACKDGG